MKELTWNPADWMEQIEKTFEERDELYRKRDEAFENRSQMLMRKEKAFQKNLDQLDQREKEILGREEAVSKQAEEISRREQEYEQAMEKLQHEADRLKKKLSDETMKLHLIQEQAKNEKTRQQTARLNYESRLMALDDQTLKLLKDQDPAQDQQEYEEKLREAEERYQMLLEEKSSVDAENQLLKENAAHEDSRMQETMQDLQDENEDLKDENQRLQEDKSRLEEEKRQLFKKLLMNGDPPTKGGGEESTMAENISYKEGNRTEKTEPDVTEASDEMEQYLSNAYPDASVRTISSAGGNVVQMGQDGILIDIFYQDPPNFKIRKQAPDNRRIRRMIDRKNKNDGIDFYYDEDRGEVTASGYFTEEMAPGELMRAIRQIVLHDFEVSDESKW